MNDIKHLDRDRLSALSGALILALVIARFLDAPVLSWKTNAFGSQLTLILSAKTLIALISLGLGVTASESLIRSHPIARAGNLNRSSIHWIIPGMLMIGLASWLGAIEDLRLWTICVLLSLLAVPVALATEYVTVDSGYRQSNRIVSLQSVLVYLVGAVVFTRLYNLQVRTLLSGTATVIVSSLLAARLFWIFLGTTKRAFRFALPAGVYLGLLAWAVNHLPVTQLQGGLIMLVIFYVVAGLIQQKITRNYGLRVVLEYVGLGILITLAVMLGAS